MKQPPEHQKEIGHNAHGEQKVMVGNWTKTTYGGFSRYDATLKVQPGAILIERADDKALTVYHVDPNILMWQSICRLQMMPLIDVLGPDKAGEFVKMARQILMEYKRKG